MVDEVLVDPIIKDKADKARISKDASMTGVRLVSRSTQNAMEELIKLISKSVGNKHG